MLSDQVYYVNGYGGPRCGSYIVLTCTEDDYRRGWIDCVHVRKVRQDREQRLYVRQTAETDRSLRAILPGAWTH